MTELEIAIGNLEETISVGNVLLTKMKKQQEKTHKSKVPVFPEWFIVVKDDSFTDNFVIGLRSDSGGLKDWNELPLNFKGRACFSENDLRQIIKGLQTLLGDK